MEAGRFRSGQIITISDSGVLISTCWWLLWMARRGSGAVAAGVEESSDGFLRRWMRESHSSSQLEEFRSPADLEQYLETSLIVTGRECF